MDIFRFIDSADIRRYLVEFNTDSVQRKKCS